MYSKCATELVGTDPSVLAILNFILTVFDVLDVDKRLLRVICRENNFKRVLTKHNYLYKSSTIIILVKLIKN